MSLLLFDPLDMQCRSGCGGVKLKCLAGHLGWIQTHVKVRSHVTHCDGHGERNKHLTFC